MQNASMTLAVRHRAIEPEFPLRNFDPSKAYSQLVEWLYNEISARQCPGLIMGISGTDSILAFLLAGQALRDLEREDALTGIHYGAVFPPSDKTPQEIEKILNFNPNYRWVARTVLPWLSRQYPAAQIITDDSTQNSHDAQRWGDLFYRALAGQDPTQPYQPENTAWVVGTRNATEDYLGTYSNLSSAVSLQPLLPLYKSEVLQMCAYLNVPDVAIRQSRQADCDCGRFDIAAENISAIDGLIMMQKGLLEENWADKHLSPELQVRLNQFIQEQRTYGGFKRQIPYRPPQDIGL